MVRIRRQRQHLVAARRLILPRRYRRAIGVDEGSKFNFVTIACLFRFSDPHGFDPGVVTGNDSTNFRLPV